jgi:putative Mg2+ transporter-C (MgtC) family protein
MFICFGAAMFTLLSRQLAGSDADSSRIASQIIPGIGFIGAGSILHARGSVSGLTTASTLFVVAGIGMAVGGGLYVTAVFATILILIALAVLGKIEHNFAIKTVVTTFEATGTSAESMLREVNRILEDKNLTLRSVHLASDDAHVRLAFAVDAGIEDRNLLTLRLHESSVFSSVVTLGSTEHE